MANGANEVHKYLKSELENYIKSQYFGKSPLLLSTVAGKLDDEGNCTNNPILNHRLHMFLFRMALIMPIFLNGCALSLRSWPMHI